MYICGCLPGRIRHALDELPETLDETYERTLREINKTYWEFAHRLLQCVTVACRPLRVEKLAEILAFNFKAGQIPKFHEDWRLEDPVDAVLSTSSNLLAVVNVEDSPVVQFSHFSVKEFLTSTRLAEASDTFSQHYHVSTTLAHTLPSKPHFSVWVWIYDPPRVRFFGEPKRAKRPQPPVRAALHYAVLWGFDAIVKFLITEHSQDVNFLGTDRDRTPLHLASSSGLVEVVRVLLEHGADVTALDYAGATPLTFGE